MVPFAPTWTPFRPMAIRKSVSPFPRPDCLSLLSVSDSLQRFDTAVGGAGTSAASSRHRGAARQARRGRRGECVAGHCLWSGLSHVTCRLLDGDNFSVGQRQLFCLARALLKRSAIIILDEGPIRLPDLRFLCCLTDWADCISLCSDGGGGRRDRCTDPTHAARGLSRGDGVDCGAPVRPSPGPLQLTCCCARRLETILDYDRIVLLDGGQVAEMDSPKNLLQRRPPTRFAQMVEALDRMRHGRARSIRARRAPR